MIILLHSSKTMKSPIEWSVETSLPIFQNEANKLANYMSTIATDEIKKVMHVSEPVAQKTQLLTSEWMSAENTSPAALSFVGDIYSGLQAMTFTTDDFAYAQERLKILSGLYGVLRPLDLIQPYRCEMGYKFPDERFKSLYTFWGDKIAKSLPPSEMIINTSSVEYGRIVTKYIDSSRIITPQFYTISPKINEPVFVTVHSKIARGAFAHWVIKNRVESVDGLNRFDELGYQYDATLSKHHAPAFICNDFGGIGLSVRLR